MIKKLPPKETRIQMLFPSSEGDHSSSAMNEEDESDDIVNRSRLALSADANNPILLCFSNSLIPMDANCNPVGRVFIGLSTLQTTGASFHMHAQLYPTVC